MRQFAPLLLVPVAAVLMAVGYEQYSVTEYLSGGTFRPNGSPGLALMLTGLAIGYAVAIALIRPSWIVRLLAQLRTALRPPRRLLIAGVVLGAIGILLWSVTAEAGGFTLYHPYDVLGLEILVVGLGISFAGAWQLAARARKAPPP